MSAGYNFKLETGGYDEQSEVVVVADTYKEAEEKAKALIDGSKLKLGKLRRVIDSEAQVTHTTVDERKLVIEERQPNVNHSGDITEYKVKGEKKTK